MTWGDKLQKKLDRYEYLFNNVPLRDARAELEGLKLGFPDDLKQLLILYRALRDEREDMDGKLYVAYTKARERQAVEAAKELDRLKAMDEACKLAGLGVDDRLYQPHELMLVAVKKLANDISRCSCGRALELACSRCDGGEV